ncbi:MAG TPA: FHA domain-containing protein [Gammaproteobacteria bacterium]|nr:FHA domain-containing protein [Gammaproteobacteria bacterium]
MAVLIQFANGAPGIRFEIDQPVFRIGRGLDNDLCIPDGYVSKEHAIIECRPTDGAEGAYEYFLIDLKSTNKTYVNDNQVNRTRLKGNDMVKIGRNSFKFVVEEDTRAFDTITENPAHKLGVKSDSQHSSEDSMTSSGRHKLSRRLRINQFS